MGAMLGGGGIKPPKATPAAPTVDDAQLRIDAARRDKSRRGRASTTMVASETPIETAAKALTGN